MNKPSFILLTALLLAFVACSKDDAGYRDFESDSPQGIGEDNSPSENTQVHFSAIATLFRTEAGQYYLQVDANTRVYPANFEDLCHTEPECPCRIVGDLTVFDRQIRDLGYYGVLDWFEFLEKGPVLGERGEGKDGVDVLADWMTTLEDGFLTFSQSLGSGGR